MRIIFSSIGISAALLLANTPSIAATVTSTSTAQTFSLPSGKHIKAPNGGYYIQAASFKSLKNANHYKNNLIQKSPHPVTVKKMGAYQVVLIGPINPATEARLINAPITPVHKQPFVIGDQDGVIAPAFNHFEALGALGVANVRADDSYLGVTSDETDRLIQTNRNSWNTFAAQLGVGYVYYLNGAQPYSEYTQWFPWIEPEINGYYLGQSNIKGDVWRFSDPAFNQMNYTMPINSFRLMFDTALTIVSKRQYSLYAIGGIGNAWNRASYSDADNSGIPCADQSLRFNSTTRSSFAWEAGAGLSYAFNNRIALTLQYLYTDLGKARTSATGFVGTITTPVIIPADVKLTAQTALLGIHVSI